MELKHILPTGLTACYSETGEVVTCHGTGQDAAFWGAGNKAGRSAERFELLGDLLVKDQATGLIWMRDSCPSTYPLSWLEGLRFIERMNDERRCGRTDWRMPNRREMRSLIDHSARKPALPADHPFHNIFLGWYWTSTTAAIAPRYAWYVHLEGGRMFYGNKDGYYWVWPVCGQSEVLACTGAVHCYDDSGAIIPCDDRQDGGLKKGVVWPVPRFVKGEDEVMDRLTGLVWQIRARQGDSSFSWQEALDVAAACAKTSELPWRMPTINELESLVDASTHSPALMEEHPFLVVQNAYWSSTTSGFAQDWAYVLYLEKGAVGVGYKKNSDFALWLVKSPASLPMHQPVCPTKLGGGGDNGRYF